MSTEVFEGATAQDLKKALTGRSLTGALRRGKYLWWTLGGDGPQPLMHFGEYTVGIFKLTKAQGLHISCRILWFVGKTEVLVCTQLSDSKSQKYHMQHPCLLLLHV
jgi:formamidopyrimidine-DNA glycosylase